VSTPGWLDPSSTLRRTRHLGGEVSLNRRCETTACRLVAVEPDPQRARLLTFEELTDPNLLKPHLVLSTRRTFQPYPRRSSLVREPDRVLLGWRPDAPIITADTRVLALGSCFAAYFMAWLGDHGFNRRSGDSPYENVLVTNGAEYESVAVVAQLFRWAFEALRTTAPIWQTRDRTVVVATENQRESVRSTLGEADVLIVTLGLSEVWFDTETDEPLWHTVSASGFDAARLERRVLTVAQTVGYLEEIERVRAAHLPGLRIVYTVSPVRLRATFRPMSAVVANNASKAILRAGLDEFLRAHPDLSGSAYFYFPSYELVTDVAGDPYDVDNRHVRDDVVARVLALFAAAYTDLGEPVAPFDDGDPLLARAAALEERVHDLQAVADERQRVIAGLAVAAAERLALIEDLHARCQTYRAMLGEPT
jgi:hypothetical protein